ncbi:AMP deaminase 1-like isoform X2 [Polyodon spathula]|uniref:AMP deaminase 1-like isoform X2 n=1 Tax=Polyodon spathula TaxID=7913 RepID=UPI001B7E8A60|nr:AMP deaminase 1-like isoform X2 [Polyodon spathula]
MPKVKAAAAGLKTDARMVAFAEKVFASVVGDEETREEISIFDVSEDCPIIHHTGGSLLLLETKESNEKRKKHVYQAQTMAVAMSEKHPTTGPTYQDVPTFQRVAILGDYASGMAVEDLELVCKGLYRALTIREKYMRLSYQRFPSTASKYLRAVEGETWKSEDQVQPVFTSPPKPGENPLSLDGLPENLGYHASMKDGVIYVYPSKEAADKNQPKDLSYPDYETFIDDMNFLIALIAQGPTKTYSHHRLKFLDSLVIHSITD